MTMKKNKAKWHEKKVKKQAKMKKETKSKVILDERPVLEFLVLHRHPLAVGALNAMRRNWDDYQIRLTQITTEFPSAAFMKNELAAADIIYCVQMKEVLTEMFALVEEMNQNREVGAFKKIMYWEDKISIPKLDGRDGTDPTHKLWHEFDMYCVLSHPCDN